MASLLNPKDPAVRLYMAPADGADEDPDGMSFYRALSRQYTKDPSDYGSIMNGVLDYYLRAMTNPQHPDHEVAHWHEDRTIAQVHTFFNALACPDAVLPNDWQYVMSFIADSLNIGLHFWERTHNPAEGKSSYTRIGSCGRAHAPAYQILRSSSKLHHSTGSIHISHFSSLIQDESGKDLILFLQREKDAMQRESVDNPETRRYNGLEIKRICWWWRTEANQALYNGRDDGAFDETSMRSGFTFKCYNEYQANPPVAPRLDNFLDSLCVYAVSITQPAEIEPALRLLTQALEMAPGQENTRNTDPNAATIRPLRRYIAIDAEFANRTVTIDYKNTAGDEQELNNGRTEMLCSVLTISVDRHLVLSFYILHMLENPTDQTVPQLSNLFESVLFRPDYMKVWWNYDQDFKVLNATIAHMFQGTPRQRYLMRDNLYRDQCHVQPTFKIASRYYRGQRPPNLTFSSVPIPCRLHPQEVDELGLACFCRLGNVDLSTILDRTCGILNLQSGLQPLYNARNPTGEDPRPWFRPKHANGYHALLTNVLRKDRLYPILDYFKDVPRNSPQGQQGRQDTFYETLKPGMEVDNNLMGYNIGDVVGVAIIMRYLTTTDDRKLLAERLVNYVHCGRDAPYDATPTEPQRLWSDPEPQPGLINFPLIEDNPRMWHRTPLTKHAGLTEFFRPLEVDTGWESYPRHEEVVQSGRIWWSQYAGNPGSVTALRMEAAKRAYNYLFDPATFTLPRDIFTTNPPQGHIDLSDRKALVRTGKPHSEDLIDFIRSRGSARCNLPRGFLQDSDSATGLPPCFNRRPGEGLEDVAGIWLAFEDRKKFENGVYRRPRGVRTGAGQVPPVPQGIWDDPPVIPVFGDWDYPRQKWNWDAYLACLRDREQMLGPAAEYRAEFVFDPQAWQHNRTITRTGVQTWQVYSPYDIGRRQYTVGPQYYSMPNTAPPGPSTQAYAPAQPGTVPHNLRQPQNSMSWSQITAQVKTGKQAQSGKQPHRYGQTGSVPGVKNMGLQNAFAVSKVPALGKRARFSDEDHFGEMDAAESARLAKSIRV